MKLVAILLSVLLLFGCSSNDESGIKSNNPLVYAGGPVMTEPVNIYIVWYGDISQEFKDIIIEFLGNISNSSWMNINSTYYQLSFSDPPDLKMIQTPATTTLILNKTVEDEYSFGNTLNVDNVRDIIISKITANILPKDYDGIYIVVTSFGVTQVTRNGYFCTNWCGYHTNIIMDWEFNLQQHQQKYLKLISIGDISHCLSCMAVDNRYVSPNNNPGADGTASALAHELTETITDPTIGSWISIDGKMLENGDLCAWKFGPVYQLPNKSFANIKLNNKDYLIQENWVNLDGGYCAMSVK